MIRILGCSVSQIPPRETLEGLLRADWLAAWQKAHASCHREEQVRASLAGLWLLSLLGYAGGVFYGENGRPEAVAPTVDLSITHTRAFVFCALAQGEKGIRIGLDAEPISTYPQERMERLACRWFSEDERAFFEKEPTSERFTELWTKKEATVKQSGDGLCTVTATNVTDAADSFALYRFGDHLLALCYPEGEIPPETAEWQGDVFPV